MKKRLPSCQQCFFVAIALLGVISCQKKPDHWNIPDEFQSWCRYREGTYWIYRNEKTQQIDCTYVTAFTVFSFAHSQDPIDYYLDWERSDIKGAFLSQIFTDSQGKDVAGMTIYGKSDYGSLYFSTGLVANPEYEKAPRPGQESHGVVAIYPTEEANGNTFTNVYHCRTEDLTTVGDSVIVDGHLVENIGLVIYKKRIDKLDTTWTLVRWHVIQ